VDTVFDWRTAGSTTDVARIPTPGILGLVDRQSGEPVARLSKRPLVAGTDLQLFAV